ncbi:MAG: cupredoxin domain-containing protein [Chloroflexi bacterium]|nr:cupredoxin domain-containing protein [Chloroflexota bacterium]
MVSRAFGLTSVFLMLLIMLIGCAPPPAATPPAPPKPPATPTTPAATPTAAPTVAPQSTPPPKPATPAAQAISIYISAENIAFDQKEIVVPPGARVTMIFNNKDAVPHNFAIYETSAAAKPIFVGETFSGPKVMEYKFTAPSSAGAYFFRCDVHPTMTGRFVTGQVPAPPGAATATPGTAYDY